jgi:hypothetical protein
MRKGVLVLFTLIFVTAGGIVAGNALARPVDPAPVRFPVTGTFSAGPGVPGAPFAGTVTVDGFLEQDGQLAVRGTLTADQEALFAPFTVTVFALAAATDDPASGCTVAVSTIDAFIDAGFIVVLAGARLELSESADPDAARELCRVVQTASKEPADLRALARGLNRVLEAR